MKQIRQEVLFDRLHEAFAPREEISQFGAADKWRAVPYRAGNRQGTFLSSLGNGRPPDLTLDPKLTGWYRVYVCLPEADNLELHIKLSKDGGFTRLRTLNSGGLAVTMLEESLWRCCDMTGQTVIITKSDMNETKNPNSMLAWLRFVPMDDDQVSAWQREQARQDTKRIYATDDIHNRLCNWVMEKPGDWDAVVEPYRDSDVEWLSLEDIACFTRGPVPTQTIDEFAFNRALDCMVQKKAQTFDSVAVLSRLVENGHEKGLKMSISLRMGAWTMGFPYDQCYFDNPFYWENQQLRCVGREGNPITALSYAFPEVQQYMTDRLVALAGTGCDAVTLIAHRGGPYVLFEKPVADRFYEMYGEYPYELPLDEPRLSQLHCQIMTEFFQKLRCALDEAYPHRHVQIHLRAMWSRYDTRYYAMDCQQLAKLGLVDAIISYPQRYREIISPEFYRDGKINLEDYRRFVYERNERPFIRDYDNSTCVAPYPDSNGVPQGPESYAQCVDQWMELERQYGVKIYMEIMPRLMPPETMRQRALELYSWGAERIALWDTYGRVPVNALWALTKNLGHKAELAGMEPPYFRRFRIHEIAGCDITRNHPCWGG